MTHWGFTNELNGHYLQDMKLINNDLTAKAVIEVLASDYPTMTDEEGSINMELEVTNQ